MLKKILLTLFILSIILYGIFLADTNSKGVKIFSLIDKIPYGDKIAHFLLFGALAWSLNYTLSCKKLYFKKLSFQLGASIVLTFAILEEITQLFIPTRSFDYFDILADVLGVTIFSFL